MKPLNFLTTLTLGTAFTTAVLAAPTANAGTIITEDFETPNVTNNTGFGSSFTTLSGLTFTADVGDLILVNEGDLLVSDGSQQLVASDPNVNITISFTDGRAINSFFYDVDNVFNAETGGISVTQDVTVTTISGLTETQPIPVDEAEGLQKAIFIGSEAFTSITFEGTGDFLTYDNFVIDAVPVPEPASLAVMGLGAIAILGDRRKRQQQTATAPKAPKLG